MLPATQELIAHLQSGERSAPLIDALVYAVVRCGGPSDARALLPTFLDAPFDFYHQYLLPVFAAWGDAATAEAIYGTCAPAHHEVAPPEVLELLGRLRYAPARPLLVRYAFDASDYYYSKHAVLGLLHFELDDLHELIEQAVEATCGQALFAEFVPALVSKLPQRAALLEKLYHSGTTVCSTDCNAGILLGFALSGAEGLPWFRKALFHPAWEASNTGTALWAGRGLGFLGLGLGDLFAEVAQQDDEEAVAYGTRVLFTLLEVRLHDRYTPHAETFASLLRRLFGSEGLAGVLARRTGLEEEAERLEERLEQRLFEEAVVRSCGLREEATRGNCELLASSCIDKSR